MQLETKLLPQLGHLPVNQHKNECNLNCIPRLQCIKQMELRLPLMAKIPKQVEQNDQNVLMQTLFIPTQEVHMINGKWP